MNWQTFDKVPHKRLLNRIRVWVIDDEIGKIGTLIEDEIMDKNRHARCNVSFSVYEVVQLSEWWRRCRGAPGRHTDKMNTHWHGWWNIVWIEVSSFFVDKSRKGEYFLNEKGWNVAPRFTCKENLWNLRFKQLRKINTTWIWVQDEGCLNEIINWLQKLHLEFVCRSELPS